MHVAIYEFVQESEHQLFVFGKFVYSYLALVNHDSEIMLLTVLLNYSYTLCI